MRSLLVTLLMATTVCTGVAQSNDAGIVPKPEGEFLGRLTIIMAHGGKTDKTSTTLLTSGNDIIVTVMVYRVGTRTDIYPDIQSIRFEGDADWVDGMSTVKFFDLLAQLAISKAISEGKLECRPLATPLLGTVRVIVPACVKREGQGSGTTFTACENNGQCAREYLVTCPLGLALPLYQLLNILQLGGNGQCDGGGGCENTCR